MILKAVQWVEKRNRANGSVGVAALLALALLLPLLAVPQPLWAQGMASVTSGLRTDPDAPIEITADHLDIYDEKRIAIFKGGVIAIQGRTTLNCDILTVHYDGGGSGQGQSVSRLEASGQVKVSQEGQNATGDNASVDMVNDVIVMTGNVVLTQGENILRGTKLTVQMQTGEAQLFSAKNSGAGGGKSGRVQGLFIPNRSR